MERDGLGVIVWLNAGLLAVAAALAGRVPDRLAGSAAPGPASRGPWRTLLGIPVFVRLMGAATLIGRSHALHDGFEVIRWRCAGLSPGQCSVLWALSALAGVVRWATAANTALFPVMAMVEPLHGFTFALLHLTCTDVIAKTVPKALAATAQAFYATIAMGAASAVVTLASGPLYERLGAQAFWAMAAMCAAAVPLAVGIRLPKTRTH